MKYLLLLYLMCQLLIMSCGQTGIKEGEVKLTEIEKQTALTAEKNDGFDIYNNSKVFSKSLKGLTLIKREWRSSFFLCADDEHFFLIKRVAPKRFIACSYSGSDNGSFLYLYDLAENGDIRNKVEMESGDYGINSLSNFEIYNNSVYFYCSERDSIEYFYNLEKMTIGQSTENKLDHEEVFDWREHSLYTSPNKEYSIDLFNVHLILKELNTGKTDTLITQKYNGDWSFDGGVWNSTSAKFYFDNSGPVACIWELDLKNRTLDKIVPEHHAHHPMLKCDSIKTEILYTENGCIKKTVEQN